ncbi:MAG: SpoIID/LytB domain-containing protein, partial [Firmicutes bacterium]|nr:SpoIID/LytB domain-containing protein [Bacillota bacterium]
FRTPLLSFDRLPGTLETVIYIETTDAKHKELGRLKVYVVDQPLTLPPDRVIMVSKDRLEFEFHGEYPISPTAPVYEHFPDGAKPIKFSDFIVGAKEVQATVFQGEIVRIDILTPQRIDRMRVLLTTNQFASTDHTKLELTPVGAGFVVEERRSGRGFFVSPEEQITISADEEKLLFTDPSGEQWEFTNRVYITPFSGGQIRIDSFQRGVSPKFYPQYRGVFEVTLRPGGKFQVINEVSLEEYLYLVVPSEMPVSWPLEALKAQAVAARTFAVAQALQSRNGARGYHVDDSTSSQVYNNHPEADRTSLAIDQTAGQVLQHPDGRITSSYFYASSPADSASPWYKWSFTLSATELNNMLQKTLAKSIGTVTNLKITERDSTGKAICLLIEGSSGTVEVRGELNIRSVLRPAKQYTDGADVVMERTGGRVLNQALLPSAYFSMDIARDEAGRISSINFAGGGSGHGLGMSQWGAKQMADSGHSYEEILARYYPERQLVLYNADE